MVDKRLLSFAPELKKYIILNVFALELGLIVNILIISSFASFIGLVLIHAMTVELYLSLAGITLAGVLVRALCFKLSQWCAHKASSKAKILLRNKIFSQLFLLGEDYTASISSSDALQLVVEGIEQLEIYYAQYLPQLIYALLAPFTLLLFLSPLSLPAALIPFVCVPLIPLSIVAVMKIAKRIMGKYWSSYGNLAQSFLENLEGLTTLKIYQADELFHKRMNADAENFRLATMRLLRMQLNSITVMDLVAYLGTAATLIVVFFEFSQGALSLPAAFMFCLLCAEFFLPVRALGSFFHVALNGMAAADKMFKLLDSKIPNTSGEEFPDTIETLKLENLSYSYPQANAPALSNISLEMDSSGLYGIVGSSGGGKSTLARILSGHLQDFQGLYTINNQNFERYAKSAVQREIVLVSSSSFLFSGTLRDNLLMAKSEASDEEMIEALKFACIWDFVSGNGGLDFKIAASASNISGGQKQRLALARAYLLKPQIYIFDEATSSVDAESEELIVAAMHALAKTALVIVIAHRMKNVLDAKHIFVMEDASLEEQGSPDMLRELGGRFAQLCETQAHLEAVLNNTPNKMALDNEEPLGNSPVLALDTSDAKEGVHESEFGTWSCIRQLLKLVAPLKYYMLLAIALGTLGHLAAIALTTEGMALVAGLASNPLRANILPVASLGFLCILAIARSFLRYGEQLSNHYIAFRLLAHLRDRVFGHIRSLAPAKLEGKNKGSLIALITSDIELLEVFYAHTVSPVAIGILVSSCMIICLGLVLPEASIVALVSYIVIGVIIPLISGAQQKAHASKLRRGISDLNAQILENLQGIQELIQYNQKAESLNKIHKLTSEHNRIQGLSKSSAAHYKGISYALVLLFDLWMIFVCAIAYSAGELSGFSFLCIVVAFASSFGPVLALSDLGSGLAQTLASAKRLLELLEEKPQLQENIDGSRPIFETLALKDLSFSYPCQSGNGNTLILNTINYSIKKGARLALIGKSGSGKSTLLKLLMRFWDPCSGDITLSDVSLGKIQSSHLRSLESYMTQDTHLFSYSLRDNLSFVSPRASDEEIQEALDHACLLDFVQSLPEGLDTKLGEFGSRLSGGQRQRIGLARVFLHKADIVLLDEPTSNLDALNEARIIDALDKHLSTSTLIMVSHRRSSLARANAVLEL